MSPSISGTPPPGKLPRSASPAAGAPARPADPAAVLGVADNATGARGALGRTGDGAAAEGGTGTGPPAPGGRFGGGAGAAGTAAGDGRVACARRKLRSAAGRLRVAPSTVARGACPTSPSSALPGVEKSTRPISGKYSARLTAPTLPDTLVVSV